MKDKIYMFAWLLFGEQWRLSRWIGYKHKRMSYEKKKY